MEDNNAVPKLNGSNNLNIASGLKQIESKIDQFANRVEKEIDRKQQIIERQSREIDNLRSAAEKKNKYLRDQRNKIQEYLRQVEGNRQLINKLLNDISHYQNDIDWYKRTYEKRSIWGVLKDRISKKI